MHYVGAHVIYAIAHSDGTHSDEYARGTHVAYCVVKLFDHLDRGMVIDSSKVVQLLHHLTHLYAGNLCPHPHVTSLRTSVSSIPAAVCSGMALLTGPHIFMRGTCVPTRM